MANSAATMALGQKAPVIIRSARNNSTTLAAWMATLPRWCPPAQPWKACQSTMCDSQVSGCQLPAWGSQAHQNPHALTPCTTGGFSKM